MATITIYASVADAGLGVTANAVFATAVAGGAAYADADTNVSYEIGASLFTGLYYVNEIMIPFDTSALSGATITDAVLSVYGLEDHSTVDFTIECAAVDFGATVTAADWLDGTETGAATVVATRSSSGWTNAGYNAFTDAGPGLASVVNPAGTTRLALWPARIRTGAAPAGSEFVAIHSGDAATEGNRPKLFITYTPAAPPPAGTDDYSGAGFF